MLGSEQWALRWSMLGLACEWTQGKVEGAERMRRGIEVRRGDGAKQAKAEGVEGMRRGIWVERGEGGKQAKEGVGEMRPRIWEKRGDGAKQAKVEGVKGVEGMKRVIWIERGDGAGARNKNLDNYGPAAKERNQPQATGPRVTAHAATPLPVEAGEGDPEGGGMLGEGAGGD